MPTKKETFSISELASQLDISKSSIRFYEEKGLIKPERTKGNQRIYTRRNRTRLRLILRGKRFGASLEDIAKMIGMADSYKNEISQIETSLSFIEQKFQEIRIKEEELKLFKKDLIDLENKLNAFKANNVKE